VKTAAYLVRLLAQLYLLVLVARVVIGLVMALARSWRPNRAVAAVLEVIFLATDPPLRLVRKIIKPVQVGPVAFDLAFLVVMVAVSLVAYAAAVLIGSGTI
jgi:YggT family protein